MDTVINIVIGILGLVFAISLLFQYLLNRRGNLLLWVTSLSLFALTGFLQWVWLVGSTHEVVFRIWYVVGVILVVNSLAIAMVILVAPTRLGYGIAILLLVLTAAAIVVDSLAPLQAEVIILEGSTLGAKQPTNGESFFSDGVEGLTFLLSLLAGLVIIGGAGYRTALWISKRVSHRKALPLILVAAGAMIAQDGGWEWLLGMCIAFVGLFWSDEVFVARWIPFYQRNRRLVPRPDAPRSRRRGRTTPPPAGY